MCGIVGAIAERDVVPILLEGLRRLEYRGYDSAGVVVLDPDARLVRERAPGKIRELQQLVDAADLRGRLGIGHTRWATHGRPSRVNAHPHICRQQVAIVHNGIIENFRSLRATQEKLGYEFTSETDTEVIVHQIHYHMEQGLGLFDAVFKTTTELEGAYALGVISSREPDKLVVARRGSPLIIGIGIGENFIASDVSALLPVTQEFMFLEEGDIAVISRDQISVRDQQGQPVERTVRQSQIAANAVERGEYRHFMLKEIYEQPRAIAETLEGRLSGHRVLESAFGPEASAVFDKIEAVHVVACGTSFHAGLIARYWLEEIGGIVCRADVASEFRYRHAVVKPNTLVVAISQSGETADTLAAMREAKQRGFSHFLTVCNVPESSMVREAELVLMTRAGPEIGVASTKAFTTQLVALMLLVLVLGRRHGMSAETEANIVRQLVALPAKIERTLALDKEIEYISQQFADKRNALFLGRGTHYPVALEGALKLKEISYIHAEAYPAGELKHGPLALVDSEMPVIAVAPNNDLLEKLKSNLEEVRARGGKLIVFADPSAGVGKEEDIDVLTVESCEYATAPILYTVPLQLLAYHVAVLKGTDIDQPRNLAKSVTVE